MSASSSHLLTLLRHGLSAANRDRRIQGQLDGPLSEEGRVQVRALARIWLAENRRFDRIISSPLARARETAQILSESLGVDVEADPDWKERHLGEAQGTSWARYEEYLANPPPAHRAAFPGAETEWEIFVRAGRALQAVLARPAGSYLIVSHGGILNAALRGIVGVAPHGRGWYLRFLLDNAGYAVVSFEPARGVWSLEELARTPAPQSGEAGLERSE